MDIEQFKLIKELIGQNRIEAAIKELGNLKIDTENHDRVTLLSARFFAINKLHIDGRLQDVLFLNELTKIQYAFIEFINDLEKEQYSLSPQSISKELYVSEITKNDSLSENTKSNADPILNKAIKEQPKALESELSKLNLIEIPGGETRLGITLGLISYSNGCKADVQPFKVSKYPVTYDEYDQYCKETKKTLPNSFGWGRGKRPVVDVSWFDTLSYCNWLSIKHGLTPIYYLPGSTVIANWKNSGFRLLTSLEWEYLARNGNTQHKYSNGQNVPDPSIMNFDWKGSGIKAAPQFQKTLTKRTLPVGTLGNENIWGVHDLNGNVWEWCWDDHNFEFCRDKPIPRRTPLKSTTSGKRVVRGGAWDSSAKEIGNDFIRLSSAKHKSNNYGFRICVSSNLIKMK